MYLIGKNEIKTIKGSLEPRKAKTTMADTQMVLIFHWINRNTI